MTRPLPWLALVALAIVPRVGASVPDEQAQTARHVAALQNADGGFTAQPGGKSALGPTSSSIRILKNVGGSVPDVLGALRFLASCRDADSGGYAATPGGKPDCATTASALMALAELKASTEEINTAARAFFSKNAKTFEEVRISIAGLEAIDLKTPDDFERWAQLIESTRRDDGTWGEGINRPRDTGGAAAALLRMGRKLDKKEAVIAALRAGQQPDGGWSKAESGSDLEATYRIMRCLYMLGEAPDLDRLRGFIARCRQSDGGYGVKPGAAADLGGTYFATTVLRWVRLLSGEPAVVETAGFVPLFNGRDLTGWEGDTTLWSARDGALVGTSTGLKHNDFLATEKTYRDFVLRLTFRMIGGESANSGVQFRSVRIPNHEMYGYQADIGQGYWGCLYDESRRKKVLVKASDAAAKAIHHGQWNTYEIRAAGDSIRLTLNGVRSVEYKEDDPTVARDGKIAVQIHAGGPLTVEFKDIYIQELPTPATKESSKPGFQVRTLKDGDTERKYTVYLPEGYDGSKAFPVVLFLHGSGERGDDGVTSAQVGLGAAIANHPESWPVIAVFPQARQGWRAGSDDLKAAVAALDDVLATFQGDKAHVVLTGLSMGGSGSWALASSDPKRFSAVAPICGMGDPEKVELLRALPVWSFVGDADGARVVKNMRSMTEAIRAAGDPARHTEYRGVGHNSWDRAYNDPGLIDWMLAASRK